MLKAFPNLPTFQINHLQACGDLVVAHLDVDHGGEIWKSAFIYELEEGKMVRETAYFGRYFEPAEWRKPFVAG